MINLINSFSDVLIIFSQYLFSRVFAPYNEIFLFARGLQIFASPSNVPVDLPQERSLQIILILFTLIQNDFLHFENIIFYNFLFSCVLACTCIIFSNINTRRVMSIFIIIKLSHRDVFGAIYVSYNRAVILPSDLSQVKYERNDSANLDNSIKKKNQSR